MVLLRTKITIKKEIKTFKDLFSEMDKVTINNPKYFIYCQGSYGKVDYFEKLFKAYPELKDKCHILDETRNHNGYISRGHDYFGNIPGDWIEVQDLGEIGNKKTMEIASNIPNIYRFRDVVLLIDSFDFHESKNKFKPIVIDSRQVEYNTPGYRDGDYFFPSLIVRYYNDVKNKFEVTTQL